MTPLLLLVLVQQGPSIDADAGFFGDVYYESWARLSAVVTNPGDEIEGELRATVRGRGIEAVVYRRAVTLPAKVKKRFAWDAYLSGWETGAEFELVGRDGKVLSKSAVPVKFGDERERQVLQVGTALSALLALAEPLGARFAQTGPDRLPDTLPPLLALDAIVFPEPQPLEPAQEEALLRWVELGGRLVFGPGRGAALQNRFWRDLCPLAATETRTVRVGEEETPVPVTAGRTRAGGAFLSLGEQPAGFRYGRGRGEVVFLAFPPDQAGIEESLPAASIWRSVLDPTPRKAEEAPRRGEDRRLAWTGSSGFLGGLSEMEPPVSLPLLLLGGLALTLYVLWIGPWHYRRLKRKDRLARGAVAFGAVSGVFLLLSVAWATVFSAREVRLRHLVLVDEGLVQSFSVLQAGESRVYDLEGKGAFSPMERLLTFGGGDEGRDSRVDDRLRAEVPVPALATRGLVGARVPAAGEIGVSCRWADRGAGLLEMANDGPLRLKDCRLVTSGGIRALGDLAQGSRRTIDLGGTRMETFAEWLRRDKKRDQPTWFWWSRMNLWRETPAAEHSFVLTFYERVQREVEERTIIDRFRQRRLDLSAALERGEAVFTGAFEDDVSGVRLGQGADTAARGLVRIVLREGAP